MTATRLEVLSASGSYAVRIGPGLTGEVGPSLAERSVRQAALVTDENVAGLYADGVLRSMRDSGVSAHLITIPAGERAKSWSEAGRLLEGLTEAGIGRDAAIVALGGGVVGDLAGFCAAVYMRGIPCLQVPTTLLAQVDSSIGGKTGVDLPRGKNLAGAFWPPMEVLADTAMLATLPDAEWRSGMAEVVKSAILDGEDSVTALEDSGPALAARDTLAVEAAVAMAAGLKVRVVSMDEREGGPREALNYGHTLGHAIERVAGFGTVSHGAAVADGIRFAASLAERVLGADPVWSARQRALLDASGLHRTRRACEAETLLDAMRADKKVRAGEVRFVLSPAPGLFEVRTIPDALLASALAEWCDAVDHAT